MKKTPEENFRELFELMRENPNLPVVPMVDYEIVGDGYGHWMGSWSHCRVDEYLLQEDEAIWFRSDDDITAWFETLYDYADQGILDDMPDKEAEAIMRGKIDSLPWKRAIIVYLDPLDWAEQGT